MDFKSKNFQSFSFFLSDDDIFMFNIKRLSKTITPKDQKKKKYFIDILEALTALVYKLIYLIKHTNKESLTMIGF